MDKIANSTKILVSEVKDAASFTANFMKLAQKVFLFMF